MASELRRMVVSATIQQSSMIKGAMLFDYVNSVHFMLQEKTLDDNNGLRVLVRMESNDTKRISDIPPESGFTLKRKISATENEALIIGDFVGPLMQMIAQTKNCWLQANSWIDKEKGLHLTIVGTNEALRKYRRKISEVLPPDFGINISKSIKLRHILAPKLSARQSEIITLAVDLGYYEKPSRTTQEEIASIVQLSQGTVAEHLQLAENSVMQSLITQY